MCLGRYSSYKSVVDAAWPPEKEEREGDDFENCGTSDPAGWIGLESTTWHMHLNVDSLCTRHHIISFLLSPMWNASLLFL